MFLARGFSRQHRITHFATIGSASGLRHRAWRIYLPRALHRYPGTTIARDGLPSCVTPLLAYYRFGSRAPQRANPKVGRQFGRLASPGSAWAEQYRYGNINPLSIDYACRPRLRSRLTQGGLAWPWNP